MVVRDRMAPVACIAGIMTGVEERREQASRVMTSHLEGTTIWLTEAIHSCKRNILEGTTDFESKPKKTKTEATDKENSNPNLALVSTAKGSTNEAASSFLKKEAPDEKSEGTGRIMSELEVMSLKVEGLRKELRSRGIETSGLRKRGLQKLLLESIEEDMNKNAAKVEKSTKVVSAKAVKDEEMAKPAPNDSPDVIPDEPQQEKETADVEMEDVDADKSESQSGEDMMEIEKGSPIAQPVAGHEKASTFSGKEGLSLKVLSGGTDVNTQVPKLGDDTSGSNTSPTPNSNALEKESSMPQHSEPTALHPPSGIKEVVAKLVSASTKNAAATIEAKIPSTSLRSVVSTQASNSVGLKKAEVDGAQDTGAPEKENPSAAPVRSLQREETKNSTKNEKHSNFTRVLATPAVLLNVKTGKSSGGSSTTTGSTNSVSISAKEKLNKLEEKRAKRMAELRGKSKPIAMEKSKVFPKEFPSIPKLALKTSKSADADNEKRKQIAAQMREKALRKHMNIPQNIDSQVSKPKTVEKPVNDQKSNQKRELVASVSKSQEHRQPKLVPSVAKASELASVQKEILSPMDTYEMSDREDSDSEDDSDYEYDSKPKKRVPIWAQKPNLTRALERQYLGKGRMDPDTIFHEVQTCDLEAIFGDQKKARYKKRTSTGNWSNDQVSVQEKLAYKRNMGFSRT